MIRVFPRPTKWTPDDELAFIGEPPLFRPDEQPVMVSATFTWDKPEAERLAASWRRFYPDVQVGGPAYGDPGGEFIPGRFVKEGVVITSRGCPRNCPFCFVPKREGGIRELPIMEGWIVCDNNLLACSRRHITGVFEMLRRQSRPIAFKGGLDASLFTQWHRDLIDSIKLDEVWFAADRVSKMRELASAGNLLADIPIDKKRCFVLIGYEDKSPAEAEDRCRRVYELGFLPFAQLYQPEERRSYSKEWRNVARKWSRPAAYRRSA